MTISEQTDNCSCCHLPPENGVISACRNRFNTSCLAEWLRYSTICPNCRRSLVGMLGVNVERELQRALDEDDRNTGWRDVIAVLDSTGRTTVEYFVLWSTGETGWARENNMPILIQQFRLFKRSTQAIMTRKGLRSGRDERKLFEARELLWRQEKIIRDYRASINNDVIRNE